MRHWPLEGDAQDSYGSGIMCSLHLICPTLPKLSALLSPASSVTLVKSLLFFGPPFPHLYHDWRVPCELNHPNPQLANVLFLPLPCHPHGALPPSPGASSTPTSGQTPCKSRLPLFPCHFPTRPPQKAVRTESNDVLIYSIKSPCGQRLAKESALQNFSFNRIS